jgi:peptide/nickel transport system ATP-binding protein
MTRTLLEIEHLRIEFETRRGPLVAVNDISFNVRSGEVFGIVGESGAGKSLTGQAVIGLLEPPGKIAAGKIVFDGRRIDNLPYHEIRRVRGKQIGMIFQDPLTSLNPLYTVGQQLVETILTHTSMTRKQALDRSIELLSEVGIPASEKRINHYPHQFSGGMRQRVVIALALCVNPKLIIADEPTTALDVSIQAQIVALLKRLCEKHETAVILITHDMGVVAELSDRVAIMYAGRIVEIGKIHSVMKHALHPYTQGLMNSIPSIHKKARELRQIAGTMPRLTEIPPGCAFHPRCPEAFDRCLHHKPEWTHMDGTSVACWLYREGNRS